MEDIVKAALADPDMVSKFEKAFEANYEHRKKIEVAKKKAAEEKSQQLEYDKEKKQEKLMAIHAR